MYYGAVSDQYQWSRVGGHLALDLCNTMSWRLDPARTVDRLTSPADLPAWFRAVTGHSGPSTPDAADLAAVRHLRDATIRALDAHLDNTEPPRQDLLIVYEAWRAALALADPPRALPLTVTVDPSAPHRLAPHLALAVAELLHRPDLSTLHRCEGEGCGWLFLDTTRNHSRRWCDSQDCGNRARVRAYTRRRHS